jgi:hypothetical protein
MKNNDLLKRGVEFAAVRFGLSASVCALLLAGAVTLRAQCQGPGAPTNTETRCVTAIPVGPNALTSFDISWVDPERGLYFLGDRSNKGVDIISTATNTLIGRAGGFVGIVLKNGAVDNNHSGPDGVVSHGRWLYAGDGDSTLKVFDISNPANPVLKATISTGGSTRLDEMALSTDGTLLLAVNNAEDPPFATLFAANGDNASNSVSRIGGKIEVSNTSLPAGSGLSIEQPAWDEEGRVRPDEGDEREGHTGFFYVSIPTIANNPTNCNYGQLSGPVSCSGGLLVIDVSNPANPSLTVRPLNECGPNGLTVGPNDNLLAGCTPRNDPTNTSELVINADTFHYSNIGGVTGADEVWYESGDNRYYTASSANISGPVLGVINATTNLLVETIPQSGGSHSVAADSRRNFIYVPQTASTAGSTSAGICGTTSGCVAVYADIRPGEHRE